MKYRYLSDCHVHTVCSSDASDSAVMTVSYTHLHGKAAGIFQCDNGSIYSVNYIVGLVHELAPFLKKSPDESAPQTREAGPLIRHRG